jgi:hypothetical protein
LKTSKSSVALISTALLVSLLGACTKADHRDGGSQKDAATTTTTDGTKTATAASTSTNTSTAAGGDKTASSAGTLPGQIRVNLNDLPDDMVICTVGDTPITVGDYRHMQKLQQAQLQQQIINDAMVRMSLSEQAKQRHLSLTPEEKTKLIETAKAQHKDFVAFLKEKNMTEADFDKEVEEAGLEFKMANITLEEQLLPQLVSREIMAKASEKAGLSKNAISAVDKVKGSDQFQNLKQTTGLAADTLKNELVKGELAKMQIQKIAQTIRVSDREVRDWYNHNKEQLKHPERIRLSSILVICPESDIGPIESVRTQVKKANPKLEGKDLDAAVANVMMAQQNKALICLGEAQAAGSNFAKLANEKSEDPVARQQKNGGDMGWQQKAQLVPQFADAVWGLKPGQVLPKLVKTAEGYRIIKVTGHEGAGLLPLSDVRPIIEAKLKQDKLNGAVQQWVAQQQRSMNIQFSQRFLAVANPGADKKTN